MNIVTTKKPTKGELYYQELVAQKLARDKAIKTPDQRCEQILRGITRMAASKRLIGEAKKADELGVLAEKIAANLNEYRKFAAQLKEAPATPLNDAITKAAAELIKKMPACFQNQKETEIWAGRYLPLTEARAEQEIATAKLANISKAQAKCGANMSDACETAARIACGSSETHILFATGAV